MHLRCVDDHRIGCAVFDHGIGQRNFKHLPVFFALSQPVVFNAGCRVAAAADGLGPWPDPIGATVIGMPQTARAGTARRDAIRQRIKRR